MIPKSSPHLPLEALQKSSSSLNPHESIFSLWKNRGEWGSEVDSMISRERGYWLSKLQEMVLLLNTMEQRASTQGSKGTEQRIEQGAAIEIGGPWRPQSRAPIQKSKELKWRERDKPCLPDYSKHCSVVENIYKSLPQAAIQHDMIGNGRGDVFFIIITGQET